MALRGGVDGRDHAGIGRFADEKGFDFLRQEDGDRDEDDADEDRADRVPRRIVRRDGDEKGHEREKESEDGGAVFAEDDDETQAAQALRARLAAALDGGEAVPALLVAAVGCYGPLHTVPGAEKLGTRAWPAALRALLALQIDEPRAERACRANIAQLTAIDFATAAATAAGGAYETFSSANAIDMAGAAVVLTPSSPGFAATHATLSAWSAPIVVPPLAGAPEIIGTGCPTPSHNGSIYEIFSANGTSGAFDLSNTSIEFVKTGATYAVVQGPGFDETFSANGAQLQGVADDTQTAVSFGAMGSFSLGTMAPVASAQVGSNGYLWLPEGGLSFEPKAATFHSLGARIAAAWMDLVPNTTNHAIWWQSNDPTFCQATWDKVPAYGEGGSHSFQIRLKQNGNIVLSWREFSGSAHRGPLVGISAGSNAVDVGSEDLAIAGAAQPIARAITGVTSMQHTSTQLAIGKQWSLRASLPDPNAIGGFLWFGVSNPALSLDFVGMTGCSQYASLDYVLFLLFTPGGPYHWNINVPYDIAYGGVQLYSQAAAFSTLNSFGAIASNGLRHTIGL